MVHMKRIGILGTGAVAHLHVPGWQRLPVELVGYYDIQPSAARSFRDQYGGAVFDSLDAFLAEVDVVDICTPGTVHKESVLAAAEAGKAIVCEKPLARHLADCQEMVQACERAGVPLFVAHVVRFFRQFEGAKAVIDRGDIGAPGVIRTVRAGDFPRFDPRNTYYGDFDRSGGVILDVGIHDIDFQRWCCGEVTRVFARGLTFTGIPQRDHALITMRFASGAIGHIECSWTHPRGLGHTRLEVAGDRGLIEWDSRSSTPIRAALRPEAGSGGEVQQSSASPLAAHDDPFAAELAHFLDHLENGVPLRVTAHDGLMAVKIALAAMESVRSGQPVEIATFEEVTP
jgi:predicted dehydrogenase